MLSRAERHLLRSLQRRRTREAEGLFLAEGIRVAEDLLASSIEFRLALTSPTLEAGERGRALAAELERRGPVRRVTDRELASYSATETPQGVVIVARTPRTRLDELPTSAPATLLVLDAVQDPGNLGTLVRTANALGAIGVAMLPGTVDAWNPKSVRASAGAAFRIPIVHPSIEELSAWAHRNAFSVYGADAGGDAVASVSFDHRAVLMVGNEGAGLSPEGRHLVDRLVSVPIRAGAESLNVAVAAGILLYLLTR